MDTKKVTIGVFVATTLVFGVLAFKTPTVVTVPEVTQLGSSAPVVNVPAPVVNVEAAKVTVPAPIVNVTVPKQDVKLGSVASPDIQSPYFSFGGVREWGIRTDSLTQATTTVCALRAPASTSTLNFASIQFKVSSTTASLVTMVRAPTAYATTTAAGATSLGTVSLTANGQGMLVASSTQLYQFTPNSWLVVGMQDTTAEATAGTFSPTGTCQAAWYEN